ncbi:MAG: hypothetical protein MZV64_64075 [Ignavibacteriales bacterium]|nr:hypothetical protein [Ignavibacteriales bacterium]
MPARRSVPGLTPVARAVGGEGDVGRDMEPAGRVALEARLRAGDVPFLAEPDLARNVARRMAIYKERAGARRIAAFVNIGGSTANIGTNARVLELRPGLAGRRLRPAPARARRPPGHGRRGRSGHPSAERQGPVRALRPALGPPAPAGLRRQRPPLSPRRVRSRLPCRRPHRRLHPGDRDAVGLRPPPFFLIDTSGEFAR